MQKEEEGKKVELVFTELTVFGRGGGGGGSSNSERRVERD